MRTILRRLFLGKLCWCFSHISAEADRNSPTIWIMDSLYPDPQPSKILQPGAPSLLSSSSKNRRPKQPQATAPEPTITTRSRGKCTTTAVPWQKDLAFLNDSTSASNLIPKFVYRLAMERGVREVPEISRWELNVSAILV